MFQTLIMFSQDTKESIQLISRSNSTEEIEQLIKNKPDVLTFKQFDNRNILFRIDNSKLKVFKVLLENGANPNEKDDADWTPLTYNTTNFKLYKLYKEYGGNIEVNKNHKTDYISRLVFDYTAGRQEETYSIIESILNTEKIDLNKTYDNGLALSHMLIINYLTYTKETNFEQLFNLLESKGLNFQNKLEKDFNEENYPYNLKKGDNCENLIKKVIDHEFYNGRDSNYIIRKCCH